MVDGNLLIGKIGMVMAVAFPLMDFAGPVLQLSGAIGGLILLYYSIKYKKMQIKNLNKNEDN